MKKWLVYGLVLFLASCGWGKYQVSKQTYQEKVQVLGVLPLLLDTAAPFDYPQKQNLFALLRRSIANKHEMLVEQLREEKGYFDVRLLAGDSELLALSLLAGEKPADPAGRPQGYHYNQQSVAEIARQNVVDALLVVVFSGEQIEESRRSRTLLESLQTTYNDIMATAAVVDRNGQVLWEMVGRDAVHAVLLQYADFDEAYYNKTDLVQVKYIDLSGIEKALGENDAEGNQKLPEVYRKLFSRIVSSISPGLLDSLK
ncbi:hypothetical protein [Malonomonas rubra]|uniref:hypothetical protein n=1 Tax=Malonomonas rubra TaxID=57040 RepID=UPI0026EB4D2B|nr:hypothetical protein [Malonomonas rubra]